MGFYPEYIEALENYVNSKDETRGSGDFISSLAEERRKTTFSQTEKIGTTWAGQVYDAVVSAFETKSEKTNKSDDNLAIGFVHLDNQQESSFNSKNDEQINPVSRIYSKVESHLKKIAFGAEEIESTMIQGKKALKIATLAGLLHHIFEPKFTDLGLLYGFLLNHQLFLPTSDLLDITLETLKHKLNGIDAPDSGVFCLVNILDFWIDYFPTDFQDDIQKITDFVYSHHISTSKNQLILKTLTKRLEKVI